MDKLATVEKLLKKIRKQMKDKDAVYFYGVEFSSDTNRVSDWRARIVPTKANVSPFLCGGLTVDELIKNLEDYLESGDIQDIMIRYCDAQIHIHEEAVKFNKDLKRDYESLNT